MEKVTEMPVTVRSPKKAVFVAQKSASQFQTGTQDTTKAISVTWQDETNTASVFTNNVRRGGYTRLEVMTVSSLVLLAFLALVSAADAKNSLYKVSLTQKGYIQYLRYKVDVPDLHDFTYCIWIRSDNFTHPQPIFSYSMDETQRLVRGWLEGAEPLGVVVHMAIREQPIMNVLTGLRPRRWHHICQGWSSTRARWTLHLDGVLVAAGARPELLGRAVPGSGDLAVGQEVTDADRGLDDGIEGEVFGFNMAVGGSAETGAHLARLGFARCTDSLGAPAAVRLPALSGARMLVSWPYTPVGLFGGATIQPARAVCGNF